MIAPVHTPGPWEYDGKFTVGIPHEKGDTYFRTNPEDARLIAVAPELLALAFQYKNDLLHPITDSGSRQRRLEAIEAVLAKVSP